MNIVDVTDEQLHDLGFPIARFDHVCGMRVKIQDGMSREKAVFEAWAAGLISWAIKSPFVPTAPTITIPPDVVAWLNERSGT